MAVQNTAEYRRLRTAVESEFINTFGGCTIIRGAKGQYLAADRKIDRDDIDVLYADTPFAAEDFGGLSTYTDSLRAALLEATAEESVLVVVHEIFHST
ncbi:MAG: hypothetical protein ACJ73D_01725 [Pyrinomonadaceae bacterium]